MSTPHNTPKETLYLCPGCGLQIEGTPDPSCKEVAVFDPHKAPCGEPCVYGHTEGNIPPVFHVRNWLDGCIHRLEDASGSVPGGCM